ncbi:MAG: glycosyltransferase family 4 protein [Treponema sp.]|nr:glycosyltransferase family 4 protein [Treponema sp.]
MTLAVDCRMYGKSGIGSFLAGVLPYLCSDADFERILLLAAEESLEKLESAVQPFSGRVSLQPCRVKPFSMQELLFFPKKITVLINSFSCYFSPYCNVPSGIRVPVFTTIHDLLFLDFPGLTGKAGVLARKFFYKYAVFRSKALFTVSEFSRNRIISLLSCKKPVHVACNGIPGFMEEAKASGALDGIPKGDYILFVGNIKAHKGLVTLLEAFSVFQRHIESRLVIVGSAESFRTKDVSVSSLLEQGRDGIDFTGYVPDDRLLGLLASARLLVQPSLYEGFGIPPLEALYCGCKVVLSDIPVFKEVYSGFPVSFFRAGDAADLEARMEEAWADKSPIPPLPDRYSYKKAASVIAEGMKKPCN